jgi:hypothetical protein
MKKLKIFVIGGSASNNFGNAAETLSWPELLAANLGDYADVTHLSRSGLTFVRGVNKLAEVESADILIMHFGTSVGWPISIIKAGTVMGIDFATDHGFHQPTGVSTVKKRRVKNFLKRSFRNSIKYLLFFAGLYKPRASKREMNDQIEAVINLALKKSDRLIWIQHRAFMNHRIVLEKWVYDRYYKKIMQILSGMDVKGLTVLEIPDDFMVADNYLFDCIHLSGQGHKRLEQMVREVL